MPRGLARAKRIRERIAAARKDPNVVIIGNRNIFIRHERTDTCATPGCGKEFSYVMTTRRHQYCPECKVVRESARRKRAHENVKKKLAAQPAVDKPRLVRFAGYDPSERPLEEYQDA